MPVEGKITQVENCKKEGGESIPPDEQLPTIRILPGLRAEENTVFRYLSGNRLSPTRGRRWRSIGAIPHILLPIFLLAGVTPALINRASWNLPLAVLVWLLIIPGWGLLVPFLVGRLLQQRLIRRPIFDEIYLTAIRRRDILAAFRRYLQLWLAPTYVLLLSYGISIILFSEIVDVFVFIPLIAMSWNYCAGFILRFSKGLFSIRSTPSTVVAYFTGTALTVLFFVVRFCAYFMVLGTCARCPMMLAAMGEGTVALFRSIRASSLWSECYEALIQKGLEPAAPE